jgi:hypothetical protein
MQNQVETASGYEAAEVDNDIIIVLNIIKCVLTGTNDMKYPSLQALQAWKMLA